MKSFADWTQEIAQSNAAPIPERSTPSDLHDRNGDSTCDHCNGSGWHDASCNENCRLCGGAGWLEQIKCSGSYCENKGYPNYSSGPGQDSEYYCGGNPRCCP